MILTLQKQYCIARVARTTGVGGDGRRALPCLSDATLKTPFPSPITRMVGYFLGGGRRLSVLFLGDATVNTPCPPPPIPRRVFFRGVDKRRACPCFVDAATVKHLLPHSQGRVACPAIPPVIFVLYCWGIILLFISLYIIHYCFPPHKHSLCRHPLKPDKRIAIIIFFGHHWF